MQVTFEEAWTWAKSEAPEDTSPLSTTEPSKLVEALLDWAPPGGTVTVFDRACRPHPLTRGERTLSGPANVTTTTSGNTKRVHEDTVEVGFDVVFTCGGESVFERRGGGWELVESSATGCMSSPGKHISKVTEDEAWFGGETVHVLLHCASRASQIQHCRGGGERVCTVCDRLGIGVKSGHAGGGQSSVQSNIEKAEIDCSVPCAPDRIGEKIARYRGVIADATFERGSDEPHPTLFRKQAACREYARTHRIRPSEIMTW